MTAQRDDSRPDEARRQRRRRLLATLGVGLAGAYVAPTLFSFGQAHAWHGHDGRRSWPSRSRPSYSRPSRSRPSRYDGYHSHRHDHHHRRDDHYHRRDERYAHRDYRDDPIRLAEDILFGRPDRW